MLWKSIPAFKMVQCSFKCCLFTCAFEIQTLFIYSQLVTGVKETRNSAQTIEIERFVSTDTHWIKVKIPLKFLLRCLSGYHIKAPFQTKECSWLKLLQHVVITEHQMMFDQHISWKICLCNNTVYEAELGIPLKGSHFQNKWFRHLFPQCSLRKINSGQLKVSVVKNLARTFQVYNTSEVDITINSLSLGNDSDRKQQAIPGMLLRTALAH